MSSATNTSSALHELLKPDGYYSYLNIRKPPIGTKVSHFAAAPEKSSIDSDQVEKNYRKLSLKHHPDKPGGDAETFRLLSRAKTVLLNDKLRREYDFLGLDLEEEEDRDEHMHEEREDDSSDDDGDEKRSSNSNSNKKDSKASSGSSDSVIGRMASAVLAGLLQTAIRTALMGLISSVLSRYKYLVAIGVCFMLYTSYKIFSIYRSYSQQSQHQQSQLITKMDFVSPLLIGMGLYLMFLGRTKASWSLFLLGESLVMTLFILNSITPSDGVSTWRPSTLMITLLAILSTVMASWLHGNFWKYTSIVLIVLGLSLLVALICPVMEMIMEEIMNEKMRKIGDKVRQYSTVVEKQMEKMEKEMQSHLRGSNEKKSNVKDYVDSSVDID